MYSNATKPTISSRKMSLFLLIVFLGYSQLLSAQPWNASSKWFNGIAAVLENMKGQDMPHFTEENVPEIYLHIKGKKAFYVSSSRNMFVSTHLNGRVKYEGDSLFIQFTRRRLLYGNRIMHPYRKIKGQIITRRFYACIWNEYGEWKLTENGGQRENFYQSRNTQLNHRKMR